MEVAMATHTDPGAWESALEHDPRMLSTAVDVLRDRAERSRARGRR